MRKALLLSLFAFFAITGHAQTTISTGTTITTYLITAPVNQPAFVAFGLKNNNAFTIALTNLSMYHSTESNGMTYSLWYTNSQLTGAPSVTVGNGWTQYTTSPVISTAVSGVTPIFSGMNLTIAAGATARLAVVISGDTLYYNNAGLNVYSNGGVDLLSGTSPSCPGYVGQFPTGTFTPRWFVGNITFIPANPNDLALFSMPQPVNNTQYCANAQIPVKAVIKNTGTIAQSNFQVSATYTGPSTGTLTQTYTNTLAPNTTDTVNFGTINPLPGNYTLKAYTQLATDNLSSNDSSAMINFIVKQPVTPPTVFPDTVCPGGTALVLIDSQLNNVYNWYDVPTGGLSLYTGGNLLFPNISGDTVLYVSATFNGCESNRTLASAALGAPPVVNFGSDTSFCESIPLVLNAGNPGGTYIWSTGDSVQSITVTNVSGLYWVEVDHYCITSDTINLNIAPMAKVDGISYVREANTYHFTPSGSQNVVNYLWIFGDGFTSTQMNPVHTYAMSITWNLDVKLVVSNNCGTDTAVRQVPTAVGDLNSQDSRIRIYPNPARDQVFLSCEELKAEEISIISSVGATVLNQNLDRNKTTHSIDISAIAPGYYMIRIKTKEGVINKALSINR